MPRNPSRKGKLETLVKADYERDAGPTAADLQALDRALSVFLGVDPIKRRKKPKRPVRRVFIRRVVSVIVPSMQSVIFRDIVATAIENGIAAHAVPPSTEGWADEIGLDHGE